MRFFPCEAPILFAPASTISLRASGVRIPPAALTPIVGPTVLRIKATSLTVAPPVENPVEVLTKSALASFASLQARTISSSLSKQHSRITFKT